MQGHREASGSLISYVSIKEWIPASHPLRQIRKLTDQTLHQSNCSQNSSTKNCCFASFWD